MGNADMLIWLVVGVLGLWMVGVGFAAWRGDRHRRAERRKIQPPAPTDWATVTSRPARQAPAAE